MDSDPTPTTDRSLRLSVLGPLRAWYQETELPLGPPKQQSVLALLLVQAGQPVPLHQIVDALWGDDPPARAVNVVQRHMGSLRRLLEPGLLQRSEARVLVRAAGGYRLNVGEEALDLLRFRQLRDAGQDAAENGRQEEAVDLFVKALSLWRGPAAAGLPHEIRSHTVFAGVDAEYFRAARAAAQAALTARRTKAALPLLRHAAHGAPLDEVLQACFIRVLAAEGHTAQALEHYRSTRSQLATELGVAPGAELRAAQAAVLRRTAHHTGDTPAHAPAPTASGGRRPQAPHPAQLPAGLHVFTGRKEEIKRLDSLLPTDPHTAVVISAIGGAPGVGKTALALHWAHRNAHRFPDGQLHINLRGYDPAADPLTPSMAIGYFLESLGIPSERIPSHLDSQIALYRSLLAGRRFLILLDNARNAEQVRPLLPGTPGCLTVVTSREQMTGLAVSAGAHLLRIDVLTVAESLEYLSKRLGKSRVGREHEAALAIVEHCGRLPLALAIVCARAESRPITPLADIGAELEERRDSLRAFTVDGENDPVTDTRSVFSWSYRALTGRAAEAFRRLWLSPARDVSLEAAASMTGLPMGATRQVMSELHRASLCTSERSGRYSTHDLLRVFSKEMSHSEDSGQALEVARRRLYDHYLHTAHKASTVINTHREHPLLPLAAPGTQVASFTGTESAADWLHHEISNLQTIALHDTDYGADTQVWRLAAVLELFLDRSGRRQEQIEIQSAALSAARRTADTSGQAHMHRSLGFALGRTGRNAEAESHLNEALAMFSKAGDLSGEALTRRYLAFLANAGEAHRDALLHYEAAASLYKEAHHAVGIASVSNEVGWTRILMGDFEGALRDCRHAVDVAQRAGNRNVEAASWDSLGVAHHRLGHKGDALQALHRALTCYRELNDAYLIADTLIHIGDVHATESPGQAHAVWTEALDILDSLGHPEGDLVRERLRNEPGIRQTADSG
ncbi:BTAD domain-containing putative transcriptional regulator [Streptomyces sp. NPDC047000]|uniref:AfsR/SARP family transcriptional regulator n=1 Tax=Streptomyces sp. NPDC047000 TaxID=3155474 RepID=UPI00340248C8